MPMKDFHIKVHRTTVVWIASTANVLLILELLVGIEWQAMTIFILEHVMFHQFTLANHFQKPS